MTPRWIAVQASRASCSSAVEQLKQIDIRRWRDMRIGGPFESPTPSLKPIAQQQPSCPLSRALPSAKHQSGSFGSRRPVNCTRSQGPRADHFAGSGGCVPNGERSGPEFPVRLTVPHPQKEAKVNTSGETPHLPRPCPSPTSRNVDASNRITKKTHRQPRRHQPIAPPPSIPNPTP